MFPPPSYSAVSGGSIVNQVEDIYNGLGHLTTEYQSTSGAVVIGTTPSVQYAYNQMAGGANNSRLVSMTYPNGRVLDYNYAAGVDNSISRLTSISDSSGTLQSLTYLGLDTVVQESEPEAGIEMTYISQNGSTGDAGDQYTGLDRFGRVVNQLWISTATGQPTDWFQYGYDQDGNVLYRNNLVNSAFGELYEASGTDGGYDGLNQLTNFSRGVLSASQQGGPLDTIASPTHTQSWTYDALGNWLSFVSDGVNQTRTANQQNEITSVSGDTTPGYDHDGNTTTDQAGNTLVYDAWNRLVAYKSGNTVLASYGYNALGYRITITESGATTSLYYSSSWQVLEEDVGGAMQTQYVWSPVYVDAMIERDQGGTRFFVQQDANRDVTAIVDTTGTVQERYVYDPYGAVTFVAANWTARSSSSFSWIYLFQGGRYDPSTSLFNFRERDYSPVLGRWLVPDPLSFAAGDNNFGLFREERLVS